MPTLEWIGKEKVINHHQDVPFRVLERQYSFDENGQTTEDNGSGNMIIRGDNLEALKALLPRYEGRVKCIYIDPPYNTGNEGWVYNDNVNDPKIKKWLGEVVGKEGEDLTRHDKWLCMMYPRLKLLQKLLTEDGAIFISIDDNELYNLKAVCDEIFGTSCFVATVSWQRTYSMRNDSKGIAAEVEHIAVYGKQPLWQPNKLKRTAQMDAKYKNPDNDPKGAWRNIVASAPDSLAHQGMVYAIQNPLTGEFSYPPQGRHWSLGQEQMLEAMRAWCEYELKSINDEVKRAELCNVSPNDVRKDVLAIVLKESLETAQEKARKIYESETLPEFFFSQKGYGALSRKAYINQVSGRPVTNFWPFEETGHTDEASRLLKNMFGGTAIFDTPKPPRLIERILQIAGDKDTFILDSFAGSGTTAHAVLNMNKSDGGHRKFILVEMMDYAETITAERVRRVINGYGEGKNPVEGTGGSFSFYELGEPLLIGENLNESVGAEKIREYVWFTETKLPYTPAADEEPYYLGTNKNAAYYFYYEPQRITVLDHQFLSGLRQRGETTVIYADRCAISPEKLAELGIVFKKIPRDISRL
ncbi:site-specific DNA-methyltransferase [Oscillospiraceae bacterium 42-9]